MVAAWGPSHARRAMGIGNTRCPPLSGDSGTVELTLPSRNRPHQAASVLPKVCCFLGHVARAVDDRLLGFEAHGLFGLFVGLGRQTRHNRRARRALWWPGMLGRACTALHLCNFQDEHAAALSRPPALRRFSGYPRKKRVAPAGPRSPAPGRTPSAARGRRRACCGSYTRAACEATSASCFVSGAEFELAAVPPAVGRRLLLFKEVR